MAVRAHPRRVSITGPQRGFRVVEGRRRALRLHRFTYAVGNALFWALWAAVWVTADRWYWWPIAPLAGWSLVLATHLWRAHRAS